MKSKLSNPPKTRKGFSVKQSVLYKGKEYKIHSFPVYDLDKAFIRKYKKDGTLDSRDHGTLVKVADLKR